MCTGWQPITLSPIYHTASMAYYQPYYLQLLQQDNIPSYKNRRQLQAPESPCCAALNCGSGYSSDALKEYRSSVQETSQRSGKQELVVPNYSVKFWQHPHVPTTTNTCYTHAELETQIKPFYSLAPD